MKNICVHSSKQEAKGYLIFSDEAGGYSEGILSAKFLKDKPAYIRSYVIISIEEYRTYQESVEKLNSNFNVPLGEEIKWSDFGSLTKHNSKKSFINKLTEKGLKDYYRNIIVMASKLKSIKFLFTITINNNKYKNYSKQELYFRHIEYALQRIKMNINENDLAVLIVDECNEREFNMIKSKYNKLTIKGDHIHNFKNIYHGLLIENSIYSPGIQLADYSAGIFNGFIRTNLNHGNYVFAVELFETYLLPKIRIVDHLVTGRGIIPVHDYRNNMIFHNYLFEHIDKSYKDCIEKL